MKTILHYCFVFTLSLTTVHCTHYFLKDPHKSLLSDEQKVQLKEKKFLLLGFHPFSFSLERNENFESKEPNFPCSYFNTLVEINRDLAVYNCIVEYVNAGKEGAHPELYRRIHKRIPATKYNPSHSIPASVNGANSTAPFFSTNQDDSERISAKEGQQPSEDKIRNFLFLYLSTVRHAGLKEIENIVNIEYSKKADDCQCSDGKDQIQRIKKIVFKKANVDYYILANQRAIYTDTIRNHTARNTRNLKVLTFIPAIMTLGLFPYWDEALLESKFFIFDKDLNPIQSIVYQERIDHVTAFWMVFSKFENSQFIQEEYRDRGSIDLYETMTRKFAKDFSTYLQYTSKH